MFNLMKCSWLMALLLCMSVGSAMADAYPSQPLRLVMPFSPGTASENAMKMVLEKLEEKLKQPIVLDNKPGAGSTLGTDIVAKAPADGYTLLASYNSSIAPGSLLYSKLSYDAMKDFKHIALIGVFPQYMVVKGDYPAKNVQELLALIKNKPGALNYSSAGVGTSGFLAVELLKQTINLDVLHVPYKGPGPAMTDLLGGRLDMVMTSSAASLVASGKIRVLAVSSVQRNPNYPDIPSLSEISPRVHAVSWMGISAPAQTPATITQKLEKEILNVLNSPEIKLKLSDPSLGMTLMSLDSEKFLEFIQLEMNTWRPVIKAGNFQMN
ncbi:MAG: tripartite tricarboxylate transporter substrate binding protein [Betaproteobacteria bacterium]|jgi:tripartite-type tricarboxylate transporter receptor subunit TctC